MNTSAQVLSDDVVSCPVCGGEYTHHGPVTVYERPPSGEDSPTVRTVVHMTHVEMAVVPDSANPSSRRDAVTIRFWCEAEHAWELTFVQHKGITIATTTVTKGEATQ
jgi:hypothetical protein